MAVNCRILYKLLANLDSISDEQYFGVVRMYNKNC